MSNILTIITALIIWDAVKYSIIMISNVIFSFIKLSGYIEGSKKTQEIYKKGL